MSESLIKLMTADYQKVVLDRISDSKHSHVDPQTGCRVWKMSKSSNTYPQLKITVDGWGKKPQPVHRLVYFLAKNREDKSHEISHLCHNALCVELRHLNSEPPHVNSDRKACTNTEPKHCRGHGVWPLCIVMYLILFLDY